MKKRNEPKAIVVLGIVMVFCRFATAANVGGTNKDSATTNLTIFLPNVPILETPQVRATRLTNDDVYVQWKPVTNADGYFVTRWVGSNASTLSINAVDALAFLDPHAPLDATYTVAAMRQVLNYESPSDKVTAKPLPQAPATVPDALSPSFGATRYRGAPMDWIAVGWTGVARATGYKVICHLVESHSRNEKVVGSNCRYVFENISPKETAKLEIIPFNEAGEGPSTGLFLPNIQ